MPFNCSSRSDTVSWAKNIAACRYNWRASVQAMRDDVIAPRKWGQVILRHPDWPAYRCFLPDLAGFTGFCRTGPSPFFLARQAPDFKYSGSGAPDLPAGHGISCRNLVSRSATFLGALFHNTCREATPFHGPGKSLPLGTLARHCLLANRPEASRAPSLAERVGIRSRARSFSSRSY